MNGVQGWAGRCQDVWRICGVSARTDGSQIGPSTHRLAVLAIQLNSKVDPDL